MTRPISRWRTGVRQLARGQVGPSVAGVGCGCGRVHGVGRQGHRGVGRWRCANADTQPQTLAHALADSPAGQLAWSGQLFGTSLAPDEILTNASLYWFTNTAASAARFYYENRRAGELAGVQEASSVPLGLASFARDFKTVRRFAERDHRNIISWNTFDRGGHWSTHEAPDLLVNDIRQFFASLS